MEGASTKEEQGEVLFDNAMRSIASYIQETVSSLKYDDTYWEEKCKDMLSELDFYIKQAKEQIVDVTVNNLTINRIEFEGYLRGLLTVRAIFSENIYGDLK